MTPAVLPALLLLLADPAPPAFADEVTVTATRGAMRRAETPASVAVLRGEELRATAAPTLDDALRQVPGFTLFRRSGSRVANPTTQGVSLRGLGGSGASRALVLDDGVPVNDPFGGWVAWGRLPRTGLDRVEVLRGGGSHLYGSGALTGVVQLVRASPLSGGELEGAWGTQGTRELAGRGTLRRGGLAASLSGRWLETDGHVLVEPAVRGAVDVPAGSDARVVEVSLVHDGGEHRRFARLALFAEDRGNGTPLQVNDTRSRHLAAGGDGALLGGRAELRAWLSDHDFAQTFTAVLPGRAAERLSRSQETPARQAGALVSWRRPAGARAVASVALEGRRAAGDPRDVVAATGATSEVRGTQATAAASAEVAVAATRTFTVTAGARVDAWRQRAERTAPAPAEDLPAHDERALSPRATLLWQVRPNASVHLGLTRAFRAPTLNELYRPFRVGDVLTQANPALEAERATTAEAGLWLGRGRAIAGRATVYRIDAARLVGNLTLSSSPALVVRERRNLGAARVQGLELDVEWRPAPSAALGAGYLLADATVGAGELDGRRLPQVPRHTASLQARVTRGGATAAVQARWTSAQFDDDLNTFRLAPGATIDAFLAVPVHTRLELTAAVENLANERLEVGRTPLRTLGPPRGARVGARLRF